MCTPILKSLIAIPIFCFCSHYCFAQISYRDSLLKKSSNKKTVAWILLGGGGILTIVGTVLEAHKAENELLSIFDSDLKSNSAAGEILLISGLASMAGSIPLFIASHKNSNKAIYLKAGVQQTSMPVKGGWATYAQPAIILTIPFHSK